MRFSMCKNMFQTVWSVCVCVLELYCISSSVENQSHCDFVKLRNMLIRSHMHDLKDVTCDVHYENYRAHCIQEMTRCVWHSQSDWWKIMHFVSLKQLNHILKKNTHSFLPFRGCFTFQPRCSSYEACLCVCFSKLAQDNRTDSPLPILPLPTPDVETERLIKMKDEEV